MAARIIESKLQLIVAEQGARPDVHINNSVGHIICHLTKGFDAASFPNEQGKALSAGAHVPLDGGPDGTTFGFVQLARANFFGAFYAGRIPSEGSIGVIAHTPPALSNPVMLDAFGSPPMPFFIDPENSTFDAPTMHSSWGDHPACRVPLKLKNSKVSKVDNFLFQVIDDRDFWTIFTGRDADGTNRYLAHFHWKLRYEVEIMWRAGEAVLRASKSVLSVPERNSKGRPVDGDLQTMLNAPALPRANVAFGVALRLAFNGATGANRSENLRWFTSSALRSDFWG